MGDVFVAEAAGKVDHDADGGHFHVAVPRADHLGHRAHAHHVRAQHRRRPHLRRGLEGRSEVGQVPARVGVEREEEKRED